jgi:hypothetical protein
MHLPYALGRARRAGVLGTLALAVALVVLTMSMSASAAPASSQGCTYTSFPDQYVCLNINGSKLHVDSFGVIRGKLYDSNGICNYHATMRVTAPNGQTWNYRSPTRSGCSIGRAGRAFMVNRNYPNNSRACGTFYENNVVQDTACNKIHS